MRRFFGDPKQRSRFWFGLVGALTGLLIAAILFEPLYYLSGVRRTLGQGEYEPPLVSTVPPRATIQPRPNDSAEEVARRQAREGARTGDVQITLTWQSVNDLDLHCVSPSGEEIYYLFRRDRTGGVLDVDKNVSPVLTREPIENIYWPVGGAPQGTYQVKVRHYSRNSGPMVVPFRVDILAKGQRRVLTGSVMPGQTVSVHTFTVSANGADLGPGAEDVSRTSRTEEASPAAPRRGEVLRAFLVTAAWAGLLGALLPLAFFGAQAIYLRGAPAPWSRRRLALTALKGLALGTLAGVGGQALFTLIGVPFVMSVPVVAYLMGWPLLGGLLGLAVAGLTPNVPRRAAIVAGLLGGALAGILFLPLSGSGDGLGGRFFAAMLIGGAIGLTIALRRPDPPMDEDAWLGSDRFARVRPNVISGRRGGHSGVLEPPRGPRRRPRPEAAPEKVKTKAEPEPKKKRGGR